MSGGAYGIDAAAHRGALSVDSATICVLAGGVNNVYPRGHDGLFAQIIESGILVSEAPPGEVVRRRRFLSRNRVIAALASATCVVEAAARSGAASTAHHAAELARPVLAVPGAVTSATSAGTNRLIAEQIATLAANPCDIAAMIGPLQVNVQPGERFDGRRGAQYREVIDALSVHAGLTATAIARRSGVEEEQVRAHLAAAQRLGEVRVDEWQLWRYVPGASPA